MSSKSPQKGFSYNELDKPKKKTKPKSKMVDMSVDTSDLLPKNNFKVSSSEKKEKVKPEIANVEEFDVDPNTKQKLKGINRFTQFRKDYAVKHPDGYKQKDMLEAYYKEYNIQKEPNEPLVLDESLKSDVNDIKGKRKTIYVIKDKDGKNKYTTNNKTYLNSGLKTLLKDTSSVCISAYTPNGNLKKSSAK